MLKSSSEGKCRGFVFISILHPWHLHLHNDVEKMRTMTSANRIGAITCSYKQAGSPYAIMPDFLKSICDGHGKYSLALRGTFASYENQTSRFLRSFASAY